MDHSTSSIHITTAHVTTLNAPSLGVTTPPRLLSGETGLHHPKIVQPLVSFSEELSYLLKALISPLTRGKITFFSCPLLFLTHHQILDNQTAKCQTSRPQKKLFDFLVSLEIQWQLSHLPKRKDRTRETIQLTIHILLHQCFKTNLLYKETKATAFSKLGQKTFEWISVPVFKTNLYFFTHSWFLALFYLSTDSFSLPSKMVGDKSTLFRMQLASWS